MNYTLIDLVFATSGLFCAIYTLIHASYTLFFKKESDHDKIIEWLCQHDVKVGKNIREYRPHFCFIQCSIHSGSIMGEGDTAWDAICDCYAKYQRCVKTN